MMRIPFSYIWRSLWARRLTTGLTIGGVALVVFVFAGVLMLARGLEATLVESGSPDNAIVLRRSATSELSSQIDRATADVIEADAGVARGAEGRPVLSREVVLVIDLYKKKSNAFGAYRPVPWSSGPGSTSFRDGPSSSARTRWSWARASPASSKA